MNNLQNETSPYLLQHKNNPVNWYPWKDSALELAQKEQKLIIISIGYAACHWCHVMEHESFEDFEVAEIMNQNYISIKVDKEERPDIDQLYMNAAIIINGQGGWPLNIIALPNGKPVYAGTYFPKLNWLSLLLYFTQVYRNEKQKLIDQAERIVQGISSLENIPSIKNLNTFENKTETVIWENWQPKIDYDFGGNLGAPKFVLPVSYTYLLRYYYHTKNEDVAKAIKITLKRLAFGGIHDIIAGGFARYSVDEFWKIPHFEKMLYDNGQLMSMYAQAYQLTKRPIYKSVCDKILYWYNNEITDNNGGLYSSLDADSEGVEGKFYCWTEAELKNLFKEDFDFIKEVYTIEPDGNFEHGMNVLFRTNDHEYFMEKHQISNQQFQDKLTTIHQQLYKQRQTRVRPATDDKILTEWNAIAITGLCDAYKAFNDEKYKTNAIDIANFILQNCKKSDYRLDRNFKNGKSTINAFLQDYAFLIEALIALHQITLEEKYLTEAKLFTDYVIQHFFNKENGMFFITSDLDKALIVRQTDSSDNVIPSGNSTMAKNLFLLSKYFDNSEYLKMSSTMLNNVLSLLEKHPNYYANWAIVLDMHLHLNKELVIVGKNALEISQKINEHYLPTVLITGSTTEADLPLVKGRFVENETLMYLCENKTCNLPEKDVEIILKNITS